MARSKSRKTLVTLCIIAGILIALYAIGNSTGMLRFYHIPAVGANKPTINEGDRLIGSTLLSPKLFDFITFYHLDSLEGEPKKQIFMFRLCGMPGDTIEIKKGDLYVNGIAADNKLNLQTTYIIPFSAIAAVEQMKKLDEFDIRPSPDNDSIVTVFLTHDEVKKLADLKISCKRVIADTAEENMPIQQVFGQKWNQDNFGPIRVPVDCYFVLGDNRQAAQDSRYLGFIPKKDFAGTILGK